MEFLTDPVLLARIQFALTAMYHYVFVPLSIGLGLIVAIFETKYYRSQSAEDAAASRFWIKVFTATFALGVATGITMEFSFGTNWADYARFVGDIGIPWRAPVRAQEGKRQILPCFRLACLAGFVPLCAVDHHRQLMDANSGRRRAFRRRHPGTPDQLP